MAKSGHRSSHSWHRVQFSISITSGYPSLITSTPFGQNSTQMAQLLHHSFLTTMRALFLFAVFSVILLFFSLDLFLFDPADTVARAFRTGPFLGHTRCVGVRVFMSAPQTLELRFFSHTWYPSSVPFIRMKRLLLQVSLCPQPSPLPSSSLSVYLRHSGSELSPRSLPWLLSFLYLLPQS